MATSNLVLRTVYISPEVDDALKAEAFDKKTSKNDLIRRYIEIGMGAHVAPKPAKAANRRSSGARKSAKAFAAEKAGTRRTVKEPA